MRVAAIDIGTNSTRLLVATVENGDATELVRRTNVTRLGEGVDSEGRLSRAAIERVCDACEQYQPEIERFQAERRIAVMTSAVRDAANGNELRDLLEQRFGFDARIITGEAEADLTFKGATSVLTDSRPLAVLDIGGGSTEFVIGADGKIEFHVSTQIGSVRFTERYLESDPPTITEMDRCREQVREQLTAAIPEEMRRRPQQLIAVAGTPTSFAAIEQQLVPYDRDRVHGYRLGRGDCERILARLAGLAIAPRRQVDGLHPDRAPTIVAGGVILVEAIRLFGVEHVRVSEHDILDGTALTAAIES